MCLDNVPVYNLFPESSFMCPLVVSYCSFTNREVEGCWGLPVTFVRLKKSPIVKVLYQHLGISLYRGFYLYILSPPTFPSFRFPYNYFLLLPSLIVVLSFTSTTLSVFVETVHHLRIIHEHLNHSPTPGVYIYIRTHVRTRVHYLLICSISLRLPR